MQSQSLVESEPAAEATNCYLHHVVHVPGQQCCSSSELPTARHLVQDIAVQFLVVKAPPNPRRTKATKLPGKIFFPWPWLHKAHKTFAQKVCLLAVCSIFVCKDIQQSNLKTPYDTSMYHSYSIFVCKAIQQSNLKTPYDTNMYHSYSIFGCKAIQQSNLKTPYDTNMYHSYSIFVCKAIQQSNLKTPYDTNMYHSYKNKSKRGHQQRCTHVQGHFWM